MVWDVLKFAVVLALIVALIIAGPLLLIWSLNTLFGLGIAYTFKTWLAALLLSAAAKTTVHTRKD